MAVDAVVFDIGNVLIEWDPIRVYDREIGEERRRQLFDEVDLHEMNLDVDRGAGFRDRVAAEAAAHPDWAAEIMMWHDKWLDMAGPAIPRSVRLLEGLKQKGVPVFALTNFGTDTFALASEAYPFFGLFDRAFVSGHLREIKPDPAIYAALEDETGLAPGRLLFTDDRPENVAAAAHRGWQTHLFDGPEDWAERLVTVGLLTEQEAA